MNKKIILSACTIILIFAVSCSNGSGNVVIVNDSDTLRGQVSRKEENITWTKEIEQERLTQSIDKISEGTDNLLLDRKLFLANKNLVPEVYPSLEDFGSLDVSALPENVLSVVKTAGDSIRDNFNEFPLNKINPKYLFNYIFFRYDLSNQYTENFQIDLPENKEVTDSEGKKSVNVSQLFSTYYIGEPFIGTDLIQVPLRLINDEGYCDLQLNITMDTNNYINQIEIIKWGK